MIEQKLSAALLVLALSAGSAGGCGRAGRGADNSAAQQPKKTMPTPTPQTGEMPVPTSELNELATGAYSSVHESFVLVARDAQTYAALRPLVQDLPDQPANFFQTHVVVAAFLGQRRSGGYGVEIKQTGRGQLGINEHAPPKGAMTTMALTAPFRVVALPLDIDNSLGLALDATWRARLRPYQLTAGELSVYGGFAGISDRASLAGQLSIMRLNDLATFVFDVRSTGGKRAGRLVDTATGSVNAAGEISLPRLDSFGLSGAIESPLRAKGEFTKGEQSLTLSFETVPATNVSDNFGARGQLEANATAPAPANKALTDEPM
ncbi:MAG: protease complex subunit PrcB family protein [Pyrinomonadaceae bacterium]